MSAESLLAILGMAAVTYAIRAGGYLLATRLPESGSQTHSLSGAYARCGLARRLLG